ncbi:MAG: helix-turn-helix domain-containing protein [Oscillospiraceae bacterium]
MASRYKFSEKEIEGIEQARKENKDKRAECRLEALEMRAKGAISKEVSVATGFHAAYVTQLVAKYRDHGLDAISGNHYGGNHRNMSVEEEATIIAPFKERAEKGELVEVSEIAKAYQAAVDHPVSNGQIYFVLHRHGWRKVMPRSKHPRKASDEEIAASKKLRQHRTIASASLSRLFAPLPQFRKWEIHTVFLHFRNFELEQKSCLRLLAELCGAALVQIQCHFEHIHVADTFCLFIVYSSNLVFILCMRKAFPMHKIISLQNVVCISAWKV